MNVGQPSEELNQLRREVEQLTKELSEARQQQTATAEVLKTISRSAFDLQAVLDTLVESVARLCEADHAWLFRRQGEAYRWAASYGFSRDQHEGIKKIVMAMSVVPGRGSVVARVAQEGKPVHVHDVEADADYEMRDVQAIGRYRTVLGVPLLRENVPIGIMSVTRSQVKPFTDRQIELMTTFADQAVIAIENARLFDEAQARNRELTETLEQQTATSTILRAIAASPTDIQPVLNTVAESAAKLCDAFDALVALKEGEWLTFYGHYGPLPHVIDKLPLARDSVTGLAVIDRASIQIDDVTREAGRLPESYEVAMREGHRTIVAVPMLREERAIGALVLRRREVRRFTQKQIDLLTTFADQAVIAIENARLFNEVKARTDELSEALRQQTATAEVLKAISRSTFDLQTVLNTLVESAAKLCGANLAQIFRWDGSVMRWAAAFALTPGYLETQTDRVYAPGRGSLVARIAADKQATFISDAWADPDYAYKDHAKIGNIRTMMGVPLLRSGELIGALAVARDHVEAFSDNQIELVTTFADQAVIAIENVRLFEEVQTRNRELRVALNQQTATSDLLKVIGRSTFDLQPVFDTLAESAVRLCEAERAFVFRFDGELLRAVAWHDPSPELVALIIANPIRLGRQTIAARAGSERRTIHVHDVQADPEYTYFAKDIDPIHTVLAVPMLRGDELLGVIVVYRFEMRPFAESHIALMENFADQAVIAIENARLFEEVQARTRELTEALQQQTATAEVLKTISRSTFDLPSVLNALVASAASLCAARFGGIFLRDGDMLRGYASISERPDPFSMETPIPIDRRTVSGRVALSGQPEYVSDVEADPEYDLAASRVVTDSRAIMGVPLLKDGRVEGVFFLGRPEPGAFTARQRELVHTFADQAVIAIQNVRLFDEVQTRNRELMEALEQQTATGTILRAIAASPTDISPVLKAVAESAAKLCDALDATIFLKDGDQLVISAAHGTLPNDIGSLPVERGWVPGRAVVDRVPVHVHDLSIAGDEFPTGQAFAQRLNHRSIIAVPLMREDGPIGAIGVRRAEVRPFTDKQIALLTTFADQAVIAIENVRLFDEVQARTRELARSVGELKALGEVSRAVNSTLDSKTVLETIVAKAVQLSHTDGGAIYVYDASDETFRLSATYGMDEALIAAIASRPITIADAGIGDAARERRTIQMPDLAKETLTPAADVVLKAGFRGVLIVPLLSGDDIAGALVVRRRVPGEFSQATVDLMQTFAAQSAQAIQNARLFSEIEEKGRQLEIASRHKSQFLANMSHELRTPLNSVLGFTEMLADGLYGELPEKAKATLARIETNGKHLLGLINDVLDLSKIEAGQLQLSIQDYSPGQIVKSVVAATEPLARAKGLTLTTKIADGMPLGRGDERRLTQVLINLAGNAVKFTDLGSVEIVALAAEGRFEISVRDTGPGIAPEHQARIFEEFHQVDASNTRKKGGTGLGLAISKRIVEMHGGTIGVQSTPGAGSTFWISIPVKAEQRMRAA